MTDRTCSLSPDPSPPVRLARPFRTTVALLSMTTLGVLSACTNDVGDAQQLQLIENLASAPIDLAGADDVVHAEGFQREVAEGPIGETLTPCEGEEGCASFDELEELEDIAAGIDDVAFATSMSVDQAIWNTCSTSTLRSLTDQLVSELECMRPNTMARIDNLNGISLGSASTPFLQSKTAERLIRARELGGSLQLNSTLRSLAQQFLLYRWSQLGRCNIGLAARPGRSNHETGLAVDVNNWSARRTAFGNAGWRWLGSSDPVHFDYLGSGTVSLRGLNVLAFQRLWNRNNPNDTISEDGDYGPQTESRLAATPSGGFSVGATCNAFGEDPELSALEVYWAEQNDGSYNLRTLAPTAVTRVETFVDGFRIAVATRADGNNFPDNYTFQNEGESRRMDMVGVDASGDAIAAGVGYLDVTADTGVALKQMGENLFEISLDRAPANVASVSVTIDGQVLVDGVSGRSPSPRNAVRAQIHTLGSRTFVVSLFDDSGALVDSFDRTYDLSPRIPDGLGEPEPVDVVEPEPSPETNEPDPIVDDPCTGIGSQGATVDEEGACVDLGGPTQYLRSVSGDGHENGYIWTGATAAASGVNFVKYNLNFQSAGAFLVEVSIPASSGSRTQSAQYFVRSQGSTKPVRVDQAAVDGFVGVGIFDFTAGGGQFVQLFDNTGESSSLSRRVVFDAVRLTPVSALTCSSATIDATTLNVRRQPNTSQSAVAQVNRNDVVQGLGIVQGQSVSGETRWMRIRKGELTGYVSMSFLNCAN